MLSIVLWIFHREVDSIILNRHHSSSPLCTYTCVSLSIAFGFFHSDQLLFPQLNALPHCIHMLLIGKVQLYAFVLNIPQILHRTTIHTICYHLQQTHLLQMLSYSLNSCHFNKDSIYAPLLSQIILLLFTSFKSPQDISKDSLFPKD